MTAPHFLRVAQNLALFGLAGTHLGACCGFARELPEIENAPPPPAASQPTLPEDEVPPAVISDVCPPSPPIAGVSGYTAEATTCVKEGSQCYYGADQPAVDCRCTSAHWQCHRRYMHPKGPLPPPELPRE